MICCSYRQFQTNDFHTSLISRLIETILYSFDNEINHLCRLNLIQTFTLPTHSSLLSQPHFLISPSASAVDASCQQIEFSNARLSDHPIPRLTLHYPQGCGSLAVCSPNSTNCGRSSRSVEPSTFVSIYSAALFRILIIIFL